MRKRYIWFIFVLISLVSQTEAFSENDHAITYQVNEQSYDGYFVSAGESTPLVLLIHNWDGLTDYEIKQTYMLADLGYSVFAPTCLAQSFGPRKPKISVSIQENFIKTERKCVN